MLHQKKPSKSRRPSLSNTMHWLSRSSSPSSSAPYAPAKPTRISEPKLVRSIELFSQSRTGALGSGATVVRTPEEALRETGVRLTYDGKDKKHHGVDEHSTRPEAIKAKSPVPDRHDVHVAPSQSPPLPPLPLPGEDETLFLSGSETPPQASRALRPSPLPVNKQSYNADSALALELSSLPADSRRCSQDKPVYSWEEELTVPATCLNIPFKMSVPQFQPIFLSEPLVGDVDPTSTIVVLETCTTTYKTTLRTLTSQPSYLSDYLTSLLPRPRPQSDASSLYSTSSVMSTFREHLASQGLAGQTTHHIIHIFLDRPSPSYAHILAYLRSSTSEGAEATLPWEVHLAPNDTRERLEALRELCDEAAYLNLLELHKLCEDELQSVHGRALLSKYYCHNSNPLESVHSLHASVYSLHTLIEQVESDIRSDSRLSDVSDPKKQDLQRTDSKCSKRGSDARGPTKLTPTPEPWNDSYGRSTVQRCSPSQPPPAGWI
ncbi:hypothetical protein AX17_001073 [Amanita inopinata Kibby_2008]|nr:hypothetical protein AX17_001073 [Amanita inopinata Kibby_2008]